MKKILFSASDPGGCNSILPIIKYFNNKEDVAVCSVVEKSSVKILTDNNLSFVDTENMRDSDLQDLVEKESPDVFVFGTSGAIDTIEKRIFNFLDKNKTKTISVLDYWSNYWQRFSTLEKKFVYLPDKVCVIDNIAFEDMIKEGFPKNNLIITGNPHFDHFADAISLNDEDPNRILFISQPYSELEDLDDRFESLGFNEVDVLEDLKKLINNLDDSFYLSIRNHPRDNLDKFNKFLSGKISMSKEDTLEEAISKSGIILGINSTVLFQARVAGKNVISYQPNLKLKDTLVTNKLGFTKLVTDFKELEKEIKQMRTSSRMKNDLDFPKDATQKVVDVIESFL